MRRRQMAAEWHRLRPAPLCDVLTDRQRDAWPRRCGGCLLVQAEKDRKRSLLPLVLARHRRVARNRSRGRAECRLRSNRAGRSQL